MCCCCIAWQLLKAAAGRNKELEVWRASANALQQEVTQLRWGSPLQPGLAFKVVAPLRQGHFWVPYYSRPYQTVVFNLDKCLHVHIADVMWCLAGSVQHGCECL